MFGRSGRFKLKRVRVKISLKYQIFGECERFSLRIEPATSEVKGERSDHCATEDPNNLPSQLKILGLLFTFKRTMGSDKCV